MCCGIGLLRTFRLRVLGLASVAYFAAIAEPAERTVQFIADACLAERLATCGVKPQDGTTFFRKALITKWINCTAAARSMCSFTIKFDELDRHLTGLKQELDRQRALLEDSIRALEGEVRALRDELNREREQQQGPARSTLKPL